MIQIFGGGGGKAYEPDVGVGKDDKDKVTAFLALGGGLGAGD